MKKLSTLYATQLKQVSAAIEEAENGGSPSVSLRGRTWSAIEDLYRLLRLVRVEAAIAAIEDGAQSYTVDDHTWNRADLAALYTERDRATTAITKTDQGGMRVRFGVPIT